MNAKDRADLDRFARALAEAEALKTGRPAEVRLRTVTPAEPIEDTWSASENGA